MLLIVLVSSHEYRTLLRLILDNLQYIITAQVIREKLVKSYRITHS
jgi:hypothetical protein